jgi:hypothetical protein
MAGNVTRGRRPVSATLVVVVQDLLLRPGRCVFAALSQPILMSRDRRYQNGRRGLGLGAFTNPILWSAVRTPVGVELSGLAISGDLNCYRCRLPCISATLVKGRCT